MNSVCYLTKFPWQSTEYEAMLIKDERGKARELYCQRSGGSLVGNIYTGKVERVLPQIGGAFVRIGAECCVFLPLEDAKNCIYTRKYAKKPDLCGGDELLLEITKDPMKTKDAVASANLSFPSQHLLLTTAKKQMGISRKLPENRRKELKEALKDLETEFGFVVRTNAGKLSTEEVRAEAKELAEGVKTFLNTAVHREAYALIRRARHPFLKRAEKFLEETGGAGRIQTDLLPMYRELTGEELYSLTPSGRTFLNASCPNPSYSFYEDFEYPLYKLIDLPTIVERALAKKVYLSSGAYLVIEPTEALTVIDVNSGKRQGKNAAEDYYYQINLEAAEEIARQLRLRNISGIILVDFINMRSQERCDEILAALRKFCREDPMPVQVLDYTSLHLAELTRKKEYAPLAQQLEGREA